MEEEKFIHVHRFAGKFYFKDKEMTILHRLDGPAVIRSDGTKKWWVNDKRHREDGPAIEYASGTKEWWIDDKELSEEEFNNRNNIITLNGKKYKLIEDQ